MKFREHSLTLTVKDPQKPNATTRYLRKATRGEKFQLFETVQHIKSWEKSQQIIMHWSEEEREQSFDMIGPSSLIKQNTSVLKTNKTLNPNISSLFFKKKTLKSSKFIKFCFYLYSCFPFMTLFPSIVPLIIRFPMFFSKQSILLVHICKFSDKIY